MIICQILGLGMLEGPLGKEPAMILFKRPGWAMWSTPGMPYMSPAAIGWIAVIPRGLPFSRKYFPIDRREASGHPKPLDELTVITASSAISSPIFSIGIILDRNIN